MIINIPFLALAIACFTLAAINFGWISVILWAGFVWAGLGTYISVLFFMDLFLTDSSDID